MVQETSTSGLCCCIKDDFGSSKIDSSCVTQCSRSMDGINVTSIQEEDDHEEEELRRRKREELIQYYIQRHEEFLKNPNVCFDAIADFYWLVPRARRNKRLFSYSVESFLKKKNKKRKMVHKENPIKEKIQELGAQGSEISEIETILKNVQGNVENIKKRLITTKEKVSEAILPMEKNQEKGVPKIESFLKNVQGNVENIKKRLITTKEKVSEAILPMEKNQEKGVPKIESFLKTEKRKKLVVLHKQKLNGVLSDVVLPVELKNKIQEMGVSVSEVSLVIEKPLFSTDLSEKHMRLSIPVKQVLNHKEFLTPQEKEILETRDSNYRKSQIQFNLIEPSLEESSIHLAKWEMNSSSSYVLLNDWVSVYQRNNLKVNMMLQVWSFRKDSNRWLALVVVPPDDAAN